MRSWGWQENERGTQGGQRGKRAWEAGTYLRKRVILGFPDYSCHFWVTTSRRGRQRLRAKGRGSRITTLTTLTLPYCNSLLWLWLLLLLSSKKTSRKLPRPPTKSKSTKVTRRLFRPSQSSGTPLLIACAHRCSVDNSNCASTVLFGKRFFLFFFLFSRIWRSDRLLCMCFFKLEVIVVDVRGLCFVCLSLLFLCACVSHCFDLVLSSHFAFASICGLNVIIGYLI